jgi:hypothetical protein
MLTQTFTPMQVLDTRPGATPAPGIPSTPTTGGSGSGPGSGDGKEWRGIGSKKEWR